MEKKTDRLSISPENQSIAPTAFVAPNATLIGQVRVDHEATILFGAVLRGDNEPIHVGDQSNVQDLACLHTDPGFPCTLAKRVTVGHGAIVHGATIEDDVLVGMGAIVLTGAKIGRESILGAGTLIAENKVIPPRSVVLGVPGKIVREVSADDLANIRSAAQNYVNANHQYRKPLKDKMQPKIPNSTFPFASVPSIVVRESPEAVALAARELFVDRCREATNRRGRCLVALSGGSTPKRLYELLTQLPKHVISWSRVVFFWGDERNVPHDHPDSNYRMVREALLDRLEGDKPICHPVPVGDLEPAEAAARYEDTLREYAQDGQLHLDITLLGLGDDAHTASLFPETQAIQEKSRWVVANEVPKLNTTRITMTAPLLNQSRDVAFLVCGKSKRWAVGQIFGSDYQPDRLPAHLIQPSGHTTWFLEDAVRSD
jgi:6-phosphogluconolactonase